MRAWILPLFVCALLHGTWAEAQVTETREEASGEIRGRIWGQQGLAPRALAHAMVILSLDRNHRTVLANREGRYHVPDLPPGRWKVRALHVGYRGTALEVQVPAGTSVELDMELSWTPIVLSEITVRADPVSTSRESEPPSGLVVGEVTLRALEGGTGVVESGLAQVVRSIPGNEDAEPTDVLLMRGSTTDLKLVLLDGAPVYTPFHMGGLLDSFDPEALGGASLFLGGAPARFDGGLSYILDLQTRSPRRDSFRANAAVDLLTARAHMESPLSSSTGILLNTRMLHNLGAPLLDRGDAPYGYKDLLGRWDWAGENGAGAFITGFWNREDVRLELAQGAPFQGARWGNQAVAAGFSGYVGETGVEIRASLSRYQAELPVADSLPLFAESGTDRVRVTADLSRPLKAGVLRFGASVDETGTSYSAQSMGDPGAIVTSDFDLKGTSGGAYAEATTALGPDVRIRAGLRLDGFSGDPGIRLAPRAALNWLLTEDAVLTLAAGRYHQFSSLASGDAEKNLAPSADDSLSVTTRPYLSVGTADHLLVALDQILTPKIRLSVQGFMKSFSGISGAEGSQLNASGLDIRVAREGVRASGWLGYTLTWFWADGSGFLGGDSRFSGRHLLSAGLNAHLTDRTGIRLRLGYGDGLPYTSIPVYAVRDPSFEGDPNVPEFSNVDGDNLLNDAPGLSGGPDDGFLRVEAEVYAAWETTVAGRRGQIRPYIRILNALNRRDALFYHFDPWRDPEVQPLAELPILPLFGLEWVF